MAWQLFSFSDVAVLQQPNRQACGGKSVASYSGALLILLAASSSSWPLVK